LLVTSTTPPRQRLLDAAADLFYSRGVGAVGVDTICAAACVSKRTLYQHFGSKDQLVAESLDTFGPAILEQYIAQTDPGAPPRDTITAVFNRVWAWSQSEQFRGCAFVNTAAELADPQHPARAVARHYKLRLRQFFVDQATRGNADNPERLGDQLVMLFDGAVITTLMQIVTRPESLMQAVTTLLNAEHVSS
jgi:AcrR family transcriptional regulator